ncbi:MAG: ABC transporter permease [Actinomycetaceae bacterium]|nr:ABC transporter permease [Actinomycetaceae bacterium]MDY6082283.1 ABC transporter permease [Actinomycetaceae bacterium]
MIIKDLKINPLRSFLTAFSMLIGILAVIAAVLVGTVGKGYLQATNEQLFGRTPALTIDIAGADISHYRFLSAFTARLHKTGDPTALVITPDNDLTYAFPATGDDDPGSGSGEKERMWQRQLLANNVHFDTIYTTTDYNRLYNLPLVEGTWFHAPTSPTRLEIVLNKAAASTIGQRSILYATGENTITLTPFNVVGTVNDGRDTPTVYVNVVPLARFAPHLFSANSARLLWFNTAHHTPDSVRAYLTDVLTDVGGAQVEEIHTQNDADNYDGVISMLQLAFFITAALLLFVSALGLINIGLASLDQRTHELLIRRALGATRTSIAWLVLGGALFLSLIVAVAAIVLSLFLLVLIGALLPADSPVSPPSYPYGAALVAVSSSIATAFLGGIVPAIKASRLQPALALR